MQAQAKEPEVKKSKYSMYQIKSDKEILDVFSLFDSWKKEQEGLGDVDEFDPESTLANLYLCFSRGAIFVVKDNETNKIVAMSANRPDKPWLTKNPVMLNLAFYVEPQVRKSRISATLLKQTKEYTKASGLKKLIISVMSYKDVNLKDKFFKIYGFENVGGTYECQVV